VILQFNNMCVDQCRERSLFSPNLTIHQSQVGIGFLSIHVL
jgi:hypothetical protein